MKRFICILAAVLVFASCFVIAASAETIPSERQVERFADNAGIIPDSDEAEILKMLNEISEKRKFDVIILTTASTGLQDPQDYADDYYDYNGCGYGRNRDGAILLISMDPRYIHIGTCGKGMKIISDGDIDPLIDTFYEDILAGDYSSACRTFASETDSLIGSFKLRPIILIPIALVLGFIIAYFAVNGMKEKHRTVRFKAEASSYEVAGSLALANKSDDFLYMNVARVPIPRETRAGGSGGGHVSSSGTSHGGGGRSF